MGSDFRRRPELDGMTGISRTYPAFDFLFLSVAGPGSTAWPGFRGHPGRPEHPIAAIRGTVSGLADIAGP